MRIHSNEPPKEIYVCRNCLFLNDDGYEIDKCPYCHNDDWVHYIKEDEDDDE